MNNCFICNNPELITEYLCIDCVEAINAARAEQGEAACTDDMVSYAVYCAAQPTTSDEFIF